MASDQEMQQGLRDVFAQVDKITKETQDTLDKLEAAVANSGGSSKETQELFGTLRNKMNLLNAKVADAPKEEPKPDPVQVDPADQVTEDPNADNPPTQPSVPNVAGQAGQPDEGNPAPAETDDSGNANEPDNFDPNGFSEGFSSSRSGIAGKKSK